MGALLDFARDTRESESTPHTGVIEHVAEMQDRIAQMMPIVKEHLSQAQLAQQRIYNCGAQVRSFSPGDRVLVLVPMVVSKFLAKGQEALEKIGDMNYKII